jgi:N-acyl-D-amino-acid deacylase
MVQPSFDLLLRGGTVVDGTGRPGFQADVGVRGERIAAVGDLSDASGGIELDVGGLIVCPGFIDVHSHSDTTLLVDGRGMSKVMQGVTTEVVGNCGFSPAPVTEESVGVVQAQHAAFGAAVAELGWDWRGFGEYYGRLEASGLGVNVIPLVGHIALRIAAMGFARRPPSATELAEMVRLLHQALDQGAWGYSTGLIYPPSCYAETDELVALARAMRDHQGFYFSHIRGEGAGLLTAVAEACEIAERAEAPVQIAHHKASGERYWGLTRETLALIDQAGARGLDVAFDLYPYIASSSSLDSLISPWAHEGGPERLLERLREPACRAQLTSEGPASARTFEQVFVSLVRTAQNKPLEGLSLAQIAAQRRCEPAAALFDLLLEERLEVSMVAFTMDEADVQRVLLHPRAMIGSDGLAVATAGPLSEGRPHPRFYGTYPRVLGHYARDLGLLSQEQAVFRMTGRPAQRLGLRDRGLVRPGLAGDLVVFDPAAVAERSTFADPHRYPIGLPHVVVNGALAVRDGVHTGSKRGRVLHPATSRS